MFNPEATKKALDEFKRQSDRSLQHKFGGQIKGNFLISIKDRIMRLLGMEIPNCYDLRITEEKLLDHSIEQESFIYTSTSVVFYHDLYDDTDTYYFEKELLKTENFDGEHKKYNVLLNDYLLLNADIKAGSVYATVYLDFYNTEGAIVNSAEMKLSVKFLSGKTQLTLATTGNANASFLEQYFTDNGIRLQIIEIIQGGN